MLKGPLELSLGGEKVPFTPEVDLTALLEAVATEELQFAILTDSRTGWFVQAAGVYGALTVEYQRTAGDGSRQHSIVCRSGLGAAGERRRPPLVAGYLGYLEKQVLSVQDGVEAFQCFIAHREMPEGFDTEDPEPP